MRGVITGVLLATIVLPSGAAAQQLGGRPGLSVAAGAGIGWGRLSCGICDTERGQGPSGYLRVTVPVRRGLVLGAEANAWMDSENDIGHRILQVGGMLLLYPRGHGFHFKAGIGLASYRAAQDQDAFTAQVLAFQGGLGYEFRLGPRLQLAPSLTLHASTKGTLYYNGDAVVDGAGVSLLQAGIGVAWGR